MSWNYRVIELDISSKHGDESLFAIHEVYYDKKDNIQFWTDNPADVFAENLEGIKWCLEQMKEALELPVLKESELPPCNQNPTREPDNN